MKSNLRLFFLACILVWGGLEAQAQIVINEFMASNTGGTVDPDYDESSDWIELYNAGSATVQLGGYFISDNFKTPEKWEIPIGVSIKPGDYLVFWADGYDTGLHTNFKLSSDGEELMLSNPDGVALDSIVFGLQEPNISMGRKSDGGSEWVFFLDPTPDAANSKENYDGIVKNKPQFYPLGGIFASPQHVNIKNTFGGSIHYTLDGSVPDENSPVFTHPLNIQNTTVIRARILKNGEVPGEVITHTYFIDTDNSIGNLPVVSIATSPENFWDPEIGIYVQDYKPDLEVPVNIELFENDGSDRAGFNEKAGIKINGLYSWQLPQKMLGVYFRKEYGSGKLDYPLFGDRERRTFDSFALRASGSDWANTLFRDGMSQCLTSEYMDVDFQGFRACVVFVNGEYLGIHNIRSKVDEDFIMQNHDLEKQKIDMVEWTDDGLYAEAGSTKQFEEFEALHDKDLSVQSNYNAVAEEMNIENFTDYIIAEIYTGNNSINHNVMVWKPEFGGKWRWILMDLDRGFDDINGYLINYYQGRSVLPLGDLLTNDGYREYFGRRLADQLFVTYNSGRVKSIIDVFKNNIANEIPNHIERWRGTSSSYGNPISSVSYWEGQVNNLKTFADARPAVILRNLENYGFDASTAMAVSVAPANAGNVVFNSIELKQATVEGLYPENEPIVLQAKAKDGFKFAGWGSEEAYTLVNAESSWKYNDSGVSLGADWKNSGFNDQSWKTGNGELGYGDGDETTVISYGNDSNNKYTTYYFRKKVTISNPANFQMVEMNLKCDDGAVVYVNGKEAFRSNLPAGEISYSTLALDAVGGSSEQAFVPYNIDLSLLVNGENTIAVEVHQSSANSSDVSFDLSMNGIGVSSDSFISTNSTLNLTHSGNERYVAVFESDGSCVLPEVVDTEITLDKDCSPYRVPNNVLVTSTGKLIIEAGVELLMSDDVSIEVNGSMMANGAENDPIFFRSNPNSENKIWGILNFINADTSKLSHVIIEDASKGKDKIREVAAISAFHSVLVLDDITIVNVNGNPIAARYSDVTLTNSHLHSEITGDLINVKYGKGYIENCEFVGNDMPDTDAVDYDDVTNGVIRNCVIRDFHGFNSDAIDIGERAQNITIENMAVYSITDKGVSVGQQSSASILNSIFVGCDMGAGLKDSCNVIIDHCTYYGNNRSVACYEKNVGDAGGNVTISNSILSNVYDDTYFCDDKSTLEISYSMSDNDALPGGRNNLFADPKFVNPNLFEFSLQGTSMAKGAALNGDMGASPARNYNFNQLFISGIGYNTSVEAGNIEFIVLSNSGTEDVDISGCKFTKAVTFQFPANTKLRAGRDIYVTNDASSEFWFNKGLNVFQWESGRLDDDGEAVKFETANGIVLDRVRYNENSFWPETHQGQGIQLISAELDNHFGSNWEAMPFYDMVGVSEVGLVHDLKIYPNPTSGLLFVSGSNLSGLMLDIYNLSGMKLSSWVMQADNVQLDLNYLQKGFYFIKVGQQTQRIIITN